MDDIQATCHCHQSVIKSRTGYESLDSIADGFHTFYYNQSTVQPENNNEPLLGGAKIPAVAAINNLPIKQIS
jgi:hypothetical protein